MLNAVKYRFLLHACQTPLNSCTHCYAELRFCWSVHWDCCLSRELCTEVCNISLSILHARRILLWFNLKPDTFSKVPFCKWSHSVLIDR